MEAPTEWTYGGQLDWSSPESLKLAPVGMCLRCIVEAIKERIFDSASYSYSGLINPTVFTQTWNPFWPVSFVVMAIDQMIYEFRVGAVFSSGDLAYRYLDHRDYLSGDFTGLEYPSSISSVAWNDAGLLDYCDIDSFIYYNRSTPYLQPVDPEWLYQAYKILNAFKYIGHYLSLFDFYEGSGTSYRGTKSYENCAGKSTAVELSTDVLSSLNYEDLYTPRYAFELIGNCCYYDEDEVSMVRENWKAGDMWHITNCTQIYHRADTDYYDKLWSKMTSILSYMHQSASSSTYFIDLFGRGTGYLELLSFEPIITKESDSLVSLEIGPIDIIQGIPTTGSLPTLRQTINCPLPWAETTSGIYADGPTYAIFNNLMTMTPDFNFTDPE